MIIIRETKNLQEGQTVKTNISGNTLKIDIDIKEVLEGLEDDLKSYKLTRLSTKKILDVLINCIKGLAENDDHDPIHALANHYS